MNMGRGSGFVEFREGMDELDEGILALTAMLNRHNHGTVYFGVDDDGEVVGIEIGPDTMEKIRNRVSACIKPQIVPEIKECVSDDGRHYVSVGAVGFSIPYSFDGRYYIRNVTSNEEAGQEVLIGLVMSRGIDPLKSMASDVQDLTFDALSRALRSYGRHPGDDAGFYRSHGLLDEDGRFNGTAFLVSDQCSVPMQVVRFSGTDRTAMSERQDFGGCSLILAAGDVLRYVSGLVMRRVDTTGGARTEVPLFDTDSFREAWVNACVHNAWRAMVPPSVLIFDDRIEVVSYGRVPFPMSPEDFYNGDSRPVNRSLFEIFTLAGLTGQSGHGVPTIVRKYGREAFHITDNGVTVTIPFAFEPDPVRARKETERHMSGMGGERSSILAYLEENPEAKLSSVAEYTGMSLSSVKKAVSALKSDGFLRNDGTNRNSRWTVLR